METLTLIKKAIREQKVISFTYNKSGEDAGTRFGNPHALYKVGSKSGKGSIKVHIVQTKSGDENKASSSKANFLTFDLRYIKNVQVKAKQASFEIDARYNPYLPTYNNAIQII